MPQDTADDAARDLENSNEAYYQKLNGEESESPTLLPSEKEKAAVGMPWFVMPVLSTAIILGSVSGPIMKKMGTDGAAPLAVGAWRHQVTATVMLPFAIWQWTQMKPEERRAALTYSNAGTICLCALGLACHFGLWIWSLDNTSLTHSLFLCILSPIFVTLFTFLRDETVVGRELLAVALGILGSTILAAGAKVEKDIEFTVLGDLAALTSACGFSVYLLCGQNLRGKLPMFVYLWPVNVVVLAYLSLALTAFYDMDLLTKYRDVGLFSWITQGYVVSTIALGLGPGFLSHVGYNSSMGYVKPLIVSVGFSVSPVVGSFIGWAMGETAVPGLLTVFGGFVTMGATIWVSHASNQESQAKARAKIQSETISDEKIPFIKK